jgi:hypothetical protein
MKRQTIRKGGTQSLRNLKVLKVSRVAKTDQQVRQPGFFIRKFSG